MAYMTARQHETDAPLIQHALPEGCEDEDEKRLALKKQHKQTSHVRCATLIQRVCLLRGYKLIHVSKLPTALIKHSKSSSAATLIIIRAVSTPEQPPTRFYSFLKI